jgi:hypothetical protein
MMNRNTLIEEMKKVTESIIVQATAFKELNPWELNFRTSESSWSILECLEHLNRYGEFYLVEIEKRILAAPEAPEADQFRSGWLGNFSVGMIQPKEGKIKKIQSPKNMNPIHSKLGPTVIDRFLKQQQRMLQLLEQGRAVDLTNVKTGITLTKLIKLRLGDTFRFVVYHNQRHLLQAEKIRKKVVEKRSAGV